MNLPTKSLFGIGVAALVLGPAPSHREIEAARAAPTTATGLFTQPPVHEGHQYKYVVYVPRAYAQKPDEKWPMILFLHGAGECGDDGWKQVVQGIGSAIQWNVEKWPFIVVFPQKPDVRKQWEEYDAPVM